MRNTASLAFLVATLVTVGSADSRAASHSTIVIANNNRESVWVTYYGSYRNQLAYGCIPGNTSSSANFTTDEIVSSFGSVTFRYEFKINKDCTGKTRYDTKYNYISKMPGLGETLRVTVPTY